MPSTPQDPIYTLQDLYNVRAAIAKGERQVQIADRLTTYRSIDELVLAEQRIVQALQTTGRSKQTFGVATKGLG